MPIPDYAKQTLTAYRVDPTTITVRKEFNPRQDMGDLNELKDSIVENGVIVPLRLRRIDDITELVDGERRLRATLLAIKQGHDISAVPAIFTNRKASENDLLFDTLTTNSGKPLLPIEEASAFKRLVDEGVSKRDIAKRIGRSEHHVTERLNLVTNATDATRDALANGEINVSLATSIAKKAKNDPKKQEQLVKQAIKGNKKTKSNMLSKLNEPKKRRIKFKQAIKNTVAGAYINLTNPELASNNGLAPGLDINKKDDCENFAKHSPDRSYAYSMGILQGLSLAIGVSLDQIVAEAGKLKSK